MVQRTAWFNICLIINTVNDLMYNLNNGGNEKCMDTEEWEWVLE